MKNLNKSNFLNKRLGFFSLLAILFWAKNIFAYFTVFNLGIESPFQYFILLINPIATTLFLLAISLYVRRTKPFYVTLMIIYSLMSLLLFANAVYYREFTDFITINTMLGAGKVTSGLGSSTLNLLEPVDMVYLIDILVIVYALARKKIKLDTNPIKARVAIAFTTASIMIFSGNLFLAETDRSGLLTRTFSRDYLVKYLGINAFTVYDAVQTYNTNQVRAEASPNDMNEVSEYVKEHHAAPNDEYFGLAKGKNVIYIHLESTQQFLIDYKLKDENGVEHEVMPFVNSLFHSKSTFSFDNFFHQVKAGKTSDAETLLETSLFGLNQGAFFAQLGGKNTFEAAPHILAQEAGYSSAVFHGNSKTFWNRNETYTHFGYENFFDASYYDVNENNSFQYGLHDKPFFAQSAQYLEHLQQPFYSKFIAVSNHYPYAEFTDDEAGFPMANTSDSTINGYFATANYLDKAVEEFFNYLKAVGLYENSVFVLYGDHYGVSNGRNKTLAELVGKTSDTWTDYDNAQMQRVPYMIHVPGQSKGGVNHTYGGQVDGLPTLLHLLGIDTDNYIQLGQDLFSKEKDNLVAFRDGSFMSPKYTYYAGVLYDNETQQVAEDLTEEELQEVDQMHERVTRQLEVSDQINNGDLLRFYTGSNIDPVNPETFSYKDSLTRLQDLEKALGDKSTSLYSKNNNQSTVDQYKTQTYQEYSPTKTNTDDDNKVDSEPLEEATNE
ncbi:LTA synthase family protein [Enterococcus sp.]|uniref:LTA synthase family protein n=1 Tax=Enterococcus sp. TaxID=35783 RepID=UPI002FC708F0